MGTLLIVIVSILWLVVGIFSARSMDELDGAAPLEEMTLPLRLIVILVAPIALLIFERHLFYSRKVP